MRWRIALAGFAALAAVAFLCGLAFDHPGLRLATKPLPVLCLAAWVGAQERTPLARAVGFGLVLSAGGDALIEWGLFLPGLLAFLCAQLAYATGFSLDTRRLSPLRALPFALYGAGMYAFLLPGLHGLAGPVLFYVLAICTMMWRAAARIGAHGARPGERAGLFGALAFAASDTLIALDRFWAPLPAAGVPIILLYWAGQAGIATAACAGAPLGYAPKAAPEEEAHGDLG